MQTMNAADHAAADSEQKDIAVDAHRSIL